MKTKIVIEIKYPDIRMSDHDRVEAIVTFRDTERVEMAGKLSEVRKQIVNFISDVV